MWEVNKHIYTFPLDWQYPVKTEEWAYKQCLDQLPKSFFSHLICFPWATLIDLHRSNNRQKAKPYLDALVSAPPKTTLIRATVCQHIYAKDMLSWFQLLNITDLYWPHATLDEMEFENIRIHPFPLFPVHCEGFLHEGDHKEKPIWERNLLYGFVGTYAPELYISPVREWIFNLPVRQDAFVVRREEWHYERHVYGEQVAGRPMDVNEKVDYERRSREYIDVLRGSIFSLCPSGSGPNSIRLWESLGYGAIPVILADTLRLPGCSEEWEQAVVRVAEEEKIVRQLPELLEKIASDKSRLQEMQAAGRLLWHKYCRQGPLTILGQLGDTSYVAKLIGHS